MAVFSSFTLQAQHRKKEGDTALPAGSRELALYIDQIFRRQPSFKPALAAHAKTKGFEFDQTLAAKDGGDAMLVVQHSFESREDLLRAIAQAKDDLKAMHVPGTKPLGIRTHGNSLTVTVRDPNSLNLGALANIPA